MEQLRHIAVTGERGAGKTYVIQKLMEELSCPKYGFMTKSLSADENGFHPIYIHPAGAAERVYTQENLIGTCDTRIHNINLEVFDRLGAPYIKNARADGVIIMDELGFMEADSKLFTEAVFDALDGDIPVIASIKARYDVPFLDKVRNHPKLKVFEVTRDTSDKVLEEITEYIKKR